MVLHSVVIFHTASLLNSALRWFGHYIFQDYRGLIIIPGVIAGAPRIRAALYMAAAVATRHNPHIQALYQRLLARGKAKMAALGAATRKLVQLAFGVLKHQQPYRADWTTAV